MTSNFKTLQDTLRNSKEPLTVHEISELTGISEKVTRTYINRLKREGSVIQDGKDGSWKRYIFMTNRKMLKNKPSIANDEAVKLLRFMNDFFVENFEYLSKRKSIMAFIEKNAEKFDQVARIIG